MQAMLYYAHKRIRCQITLYIPLCYSEAVLELPNEKIALRGEKTIQLQHNEKLHELAFCLFVKVSSCERFHKFKY